MSSPEIWVDQVNISRRELLRGAGAFGAALLGGSALAAVGEMWTPDYAEASTISPEHQRMGELGFIDGNMRLRTLAFQLVQSIQIDNKIGKQTRGALQNPINLQTFADQRGYTNFDGQWYNGKGIDIIVDKSARQAEKIEHDMALAMLFKDGVPQYAWMVTVGLGAPKPRGDGRTANNTETTNGDFTVGNMSRTYWKSRAYPEAYLLNPIFFNGGIAFHGCVNVDKNGNKTPTDSPDRINGFRGSGGCVRTSASMMDTLWSAIKPDIDKGRRVAVRVIGRSRQ